MKLSDRISLPKNQYYYNENGEMSRYGKKRKSIGIKYHLERAEKDLMLA